MKLNPASRKASRIVNEVGSSIVQPNTFPPRQRGETSSSDVPNFLVFMLLLLPDEPGSRYGDDMLRWLILIFWTPPLFAQDDAIRGLLSDSQAAWNRGDLAAFASYYE